LMFAKVHVMSMTVVPAEIQLGRNRPQVLCDAEVRFGLKPTR